MWTTLLSNTYMKSVFKYICLSALLCICCSCSLEEFELDNFSKVTIDFVACPTDYNNVDVATRSADEYDFETAIHTAYLLLFDAKGDRIYFSEVDAESRLQRVTLKGLSTITACFVANVDKTAVEGIMNLDAFNSVVLDIEYASYSEADNHLGVPKLNVDGTYYPCFPMVGVRIMDVSQMTKIEIPLTKLFAKISVKINMKLTNIGVGQISPTLVNYELDQYQLHNLPTKVNLIKNDNGDSQWRGSADAFIGKSDVDPVSSPNYLGMQTININDNDNNPSNNTGNVKAIEFCLYVPEYYLSPIAVPTEDQKSKPKNYDTKNNYAIYLELIGEVNQGLIDNTGIRHRIYLGGDHIKDFTLKRNVNYNNQITITGIQKNDKGTGEDLDHRVSTDIINNPVAQAGKAANCYIIAKPGEYTIPAYKGAYNVLANATLCMAGKDLSEYDTRVDILANMVEYQNLTSITFSKDPVYDAETNTISFIVNPMLSNNWVPNGCVIMALQYRRKGETEWITEWSWHLWFVFNIESSEDGWGTIGSQKMPDGKTEMMDRNLGVNFFPIPLVNDNAGSKIGFYYKYGEHTPYLDPDGDGIYTKHGGGSIDGSSPTWNNSAEKSETDPCPPGYRVPSTDTWTKVPSSTMSHDPIVGGYIFYRSGSTSIYYPYSGYLDDKNKLQRNAINDPEDTDLDLGKIPESQPWNKLASDLLGQDPRTKYPYKEVKVKYNIINTDVSGTLWANGPDSDNKDVFSYGYKEEGYEITECSFIRGTGWSESGWISKTYTPIYSTTTPTIITAIKNEDGTIKVTAEAALKEYDSELYERINKEIQAKHSNRPWWDILGVTELFNKSEFGESRTSTNNYGYQIRCVKEKEISSEH